MDYNKLRHARALYAIWKSLRSQIKDNRLQDTKSYAVKIEGRSLNMLYAMSKRMYQDTKDLQRIGF